MAEDIQKLTIFNVISMDEEREKEFNLFFNKYNLLPLFSNEHRAGTIRVNDTELRATINPGGAYHEVLKDFSEYLLWSTDNKRYESSIFRIIYEARSMQGMVNKIRKIKQKIEHEINIEHMFNMWNIVYYAKELK